MKKVPDSAKKTVLIYSGELLLFSIVFLVIAILEFTRVFTISDRHRTIFNWVTIFGGTWLIVDFFWALFSKKRQKRIALIDKILHLPLGIYLVTFDTYAFITNPDTSLFQICIPIALSYIAICYAFESVYHYFNPIQSLLIEEEEKEKGAEDHEQSEKTN